MYTNTAYNTYAQNNVEVESPAKLIEMLYEGVLRFNAQTKKAMKDKNIEKKFYWANRSISIIMELVTILDAKQNGSIAVYLMGLYNYQIQLISRAIAHDEIEKLDEVNKVFKGLLEAWRETTDVAQ
ncbi:MAG: flagellar export chaperone FliS [Epsilonproteobacteria bacterium]|nr:flagellar export chaperone FliS [Campylobacterota bacterium]